MLISLVLMMSEKVDTNHKVYALCHALQKEAAALDTNFARKWDAKRYVVILYTTASVAKIKSMKLKASLLPPQTLIVCREAMEDLLKPFGTGSVLMEMLRAQADMEHDEMTEYLSKKQAMEKQA